MGQDTSMILGPATLSVTMASPYSSENAVKAAGDYSLDTLSMRAITRWRW
jgi:hypothetical protein